MEGSDCGLVPSAIPTDGSVDCGELIKKSVKLFEISREISFDILNRGKPIARPRSSVGRYTSGCFETFSFLNIHRVVFLEV